MLKLRTSLINLLILISFRLKSEAFSTQYYGNTRHAVLTNHCYYEDLDLAVPVNQTLYPVNLKYVCVKIICRDDYVLLVKHCDRILTPHGCAATTYNYSKPYPACCYKVICS